MIRHLLTLVILLELPSLGIFWTVSSAQSAEEMSLFNGKNLSGWSTFIWNGRQRKQDTQTPAEAVWKVEDGILICQGRPVGYLRTKGEHENYKLLLEWRWPPGSIGGNSGVLVHTTTPQALGPWPKSVEVQLYKRNAGDFWVIGTDLDVDNEEQRKRGRRHLNLTNDSERPMGEWNKMEITCKGNEIIVRVNGHLVNHATNCTVSRGAICLQAEGAEIHFRNIVLKSILP